MRLLSCVVFLFTADMAFSGDDFKPEPGFKLIFNGKDLTGWQTSGGKPQSLAGKMEAFGGRFKVADGMLVYDPKVKGDRYIETTQPVSGDFTIRFDFKPGAGCNNDILFLGTKFDIKAGGKDAVKGVKLDEWNTMEIVVKGGSAEFRINGARSATHKTKGDKGPFILRAEFGPMVVKNLRMSTGK
ncbi:MAG TPA: DUF1080 domain-containing protein [Gemmata sp.]|nr:DUF1080 domain-containing protein [Gemmata sp.]